MVQLPPPEPIGALVSPADRHLDRVDVVVWNPPTGRVRVLPGVPGSTILPSPGTPGWERVAVVRVPAGSSTVTQDLIENVG